MPGASGPPVACRRCDQGHLCPGDADKLIQLATATVHDRRPSDPSPGPLTGICLLLLPLHAWAVAALAGVSALAVVPPGRPEDGITATAVPA